MPSTGKLSTDSLYGNLLSPMRRPTILRENRKLVLFCHIWWGNDVNRSEIQKSHKTVKSLLLGSIDIFCMFYLVFALRRFQSFWLLHSLFYLKISGDNTDTYKYIHLCCEYIDEKRIAATQKRTSILSFVSSSYFLLSLSISINFILCIQILVRIVRLKKLFYITRSFIRLLYVHFKKNLFRS